MPFLDRDRWNLLEPLLDHALELDPGERSAWLDSLSVESPGLAADLTALLSSERSADAAGFLSDRVVSDLAGLEVGAYTIERPLGHGGMGSIWLARRTDGRYEGLVAVKFLSLALLSAAGRERFRREGSVLARLHHPGIARLLDAGVTRWGQPHLVLEYVDGTRIDRHAEDTGLGIADRIRLVLQVLAAVGHAHANLIVHRDLKPSNILVTGAGEVKLLDFGIAKLLDTEGMGPGTALTVEGGRAFTPEFAAPEQVRGEPVTTATDVYALGVLLYILLGGRHPTAESRHTPADVIRALDEVEPRRLGLGDLDNVVAKALRKVPADRYQTVAELADDLERYLRHEAVRARPASLGYRAGKFLRRHRAAVLAAGLTVAGLLGATGFSIAQMREARRQRDVAVRERRHAAAQTQFQGFLISQVGEEPITMRQILDRAREALERRYSGDPRFLGSMLLELSGRYADLGDGQIRRTLLARAESLATEGRVELPRAVVRCHLADTFRNLGAYDSARAAFDEADALLRTAPNPQAEIECLEWRALLEQETRHGEASVRVMERALALADSLGEGNEADYFGLLGTYATSLDVIGRWRDAVRVFDRVLHGMDSAGRGGEMARMILQHNKAVTLVQLGETAVAERELYAVLRQVAGSDTSGRIHWHPLIHYAETALAQGETDSALKYFDLLYRQAVRDTAHYWQGRGAYGLARAQLAAGRVGDARRTAGAFRRVAAAFPRVRSTDDVLPDSFALDGMLALATGAPAEAYSDFVTCLHDHGFYSGKRIRVLRTVVLLTAEAALARGWPDSALRYARTAAAIAAHDSLTLVRSTRVGEARLLEARALLARGDTAAGRLVLTQALRGLSAGGGDGHPRTREAQGLLQRVGEGPGSFN